MVSAETTLYLSAEFLEIDLHIRLKVYDCLHRASVRPCFTS